MSGGTRIAVFTDTLGDVNGVARFVRALAEDAGVRGAEGGNTAPALRVFTSTRMTVPRMAEVMNIRPRAAVRMPGYANLEVIWADRPALRRAARAFVPNVLHVSTPGPVGLAGRRLALQMQREGHGVVLAGTYHTDFAAYVSKLFEDDALTWVTRRMLRWFYAPFEMVLARSEAARVAMRAVGIGDERSAVLRCGVDLGRFAPSAERRVAEGTPRESPVTVLCCGRVSVEKNVGVLMRIWPSVVRACAARGVRARLVVAGDGPMLSAMRAALARSPCEFLGFVEGDNLVAAYHGADLLAFPSLTDTLGQVALEAIACGVPVLVSDQGGPRSVVDRTGGGMAVESAGGDRAWAAVLERMILDAELRRTLRERALAARDGLGIAESLADFRRHHERALTAARGRSRR
ncbi:hypothetical protein BH11PLA1_BH11PLA1_04290 [soil metagenome]